MLQRKEEIIERKNIIVNKCPHCDFEFTVHRVVRDDSSCGCDWSYKLENIAMQGMDFCVHCGKTLDG